MDPTGAMGKSIVFAVKPDSMRQNLTKIFNELQPNIAVTITSRIPESSTISKEFRDNRRVERIAVSVDMLSTGYNCRDLLNIALMRPIFSPTEYVQIKGRGTRLFKFRVGNTEYEKKNFFLLDFCGVAEYFEDKYDYSVPLRLPPGKKGPRLPITPAGMRGTGEDGLPYGPDGETPPREIPVWEGVDILESREVIEVGPDGEKVDVMTFRGSFERDVRDFAEQDAEMKKAVEEEDDDTVEIVVNERFFHRPVMFYSRDKLVASYGVPAPTPAFVYNAVGKKPLPTKDEIIADVVDSISARFNLRYNEQKWLDATTQLLIEDPDARRRFMAGDMTIFTFSQFNQLGGINALTQFEAREKVFEALRQSSLVQQTPSGATTQ
jgi:hypothetical protein